MRFKFLDWLIYKVTELNLKLQSWGMNKADNNQKKWLKGKFKK